MKTNNTTSPEFVALIGFDWGHQSHAIALWAERKTETLTLEHSAENLHSWLDQLEQRFGARPVAVAIESTKGPAVYAFLERPWITIYPIHPATSTRHRSAFRPSGAKDDLPDALVLLTLLQQHRDRLRPLVPEEESIRTLTRLVEARRKAVDRRTLLANQLLSTLRDYYPQAEELVGHSLSTELALDFLARWPRLVDVKAARKSTLTSFYLRHNVRRPELIQARLAVVSGATLLTRDPAIIEVSVRTVRLLVAELRVLQQHITSFEDAIAEVFASHPEKGFFAELPGAGRILAPRLLAAFGTWRGRFVNAAAMQRHFGVAPVTEKSGNRQWVHWRWNASHFIRQTLVEWAGQTVVYSPWAKAYYQHQKAKGSGHWGILRALAFKWLRILWRCWQRSELYDEKKYLNQLEQRRSPIALTARQFAQTMSI